MIDPKNMHLHGPVVDRAHLDRMTGGDASLAQEVLDMFLEHGPMWLRAVGPDQDYESCAGGAHAIKGAARNIGAWVLAEACEDVETFARAAKGTRDDKRLWHEAILSAFDEAKLAIATIQHDLAMKSLRG